MNPKSEVVNFLDWGYTHRIERVFDLPFNKHQLKHYFGTRFYAGYREPQEVLSGNIDYAREWLAYGDRRTGRSTLLGLCFLEVAATYQGKMISVFDHHSDRDSVRRMLGTISDLAKRHPLFSSQIELHSNKSAIVFHPVFLKKITGYKRSLRQD